MILFTPTHIPDIALIKPQVFEDERGYFWETYQMNRYKDVGIPASFVQDNHSGSKHGTLRGLHYQIRQAQGKLIHVVSGEVFDVAVDLRRSSPTFGKWLGFYLSAGNKHQLWIPEGFAHGFYTVSDWAEVVYKTTDYYAPQWERTLVWNDVGVGIRWPLLNEELPILSPKDAAGLPFEQLEVYD